MQNSPIAVRANSHEHCWHSSGNDEVEEPLGRRGVRDVHGSETGSRDLGGVDPARWAPAELEEPAARTSVHAVMPEISSNRSAGNSYLHGEDEDADQCDVTSRGHGLAFGRWRNPNIQADVEHADALGDGAHEQRPPAAERIRQEQQEGNAAADLDDAVDASAKETGRGAGDAEVLEDGRGVRVDGVGTRHLLADHEPDANEGAVAVAFDGPHLLVQVRGRGVSNEAALMLELFDDLGELFLEVGVRGGKVAKMRQHVLALLPAVLAGEPTG